MRKLCLEGSVMAGPHHQEVMSGPHLFTVMVGQIHFIGMSGPEILIFLPTVISLIQDPTHLCHQDMGLFSLQY